MENSAGTVSIVGALSAASASFSGGINVSGAFSGTSIGISGNMSAATADLSGNVSIGGNLDVSGTAAIGTTTANGSSQLDIAGTKALLIPRLTTTERNSLTPANGMIIYNETVNIFQIYQNGGWKGMSGKSAGIKPKVSGNDNGTITTTNILTETGVGTLLGIHVTGASGFISSLRIAIDSATSTFNIVGTSTGQTVIVDTGTSALYGITTGASSFNELNLNFKNSLDVSIAGNVTAQTMSAIILYEVE